MSTLIIAEHNHTTLHASTFNLATAAKTLGDFDILVAGHQCQEAAAAAAMVEGARKVLVANDETLKHQLPEDIAPIVINLASQYSHIIAAATTTGKNLVPRVAALLDIQAISDVQKVIDSATFERPIYAGNVIATVKSEQDKQILTVRTTAFDAAGRQASAAPIESLNTAGTSGLSEFVSEELAQSERPELTEASIVVSGGRGLGSAENFDLLYTLADKLNAAVGASRAAVDAGFVPNDMQVGQTGKIVAPDLYIAVGISGAIQHLAGMKDSKVIVAINKDEDAPIFQVADFGLVADLFEAVPELTNKL